MHKTATSTLALMLVLAAPAVAGDSAPTYAARAASKLKDALPGYDVAPTDPHSIKISKSGATAFEVSLDRIQHYCESNGLGCDAEIADFATKVAQVVKDRDAPPTAMQLRIVVRTKEYLNEIETVASAHKATEFVYAPLAGELITVCYFDSPAGMRPAALDDLKPLNLASPEALAICTKNLRAVLPPLADAANKSWSGKLGVLTGDAYESSYVALHDDWAPVAAKLNGHLLVATPETTVVLFMEEHDGRDAGDLAEIARKGMRTASRPISDQVLRWTPSGWEVAYP